MTIQSAAEARIRTDNNRYKFEERERRDVEKQLKEIDSAIFEASTKGENSIRVDSFISLKVQDKLKELKFKVEYIDVDDIVGGFYAISW